MNFQDNFEGKIAARCIIAVPSFTSHAPRPSLLRLLPQLRRSRDGLWLTGVSESRYPPVGGF